MDIPMACILSFNLSTSSIRACSSAIDFNFRSQWPRDVSNHLEYHPEAPRGHDATTSWNQVETVLLQATPEGPKSFLDNQWQVRSSSGLLSTYVCCSNSTLMIELVGITRWTQQVDSAPSAHEGLKPPKACSLLTDKGRKDFCFVHHYEV